MEMVRSLGRAGAGADVATLRFLAELLADRTTRVLPVVRSAPSRRTSRGRSLAEWGRRFRGPCAGRRFPRLAVGDFAALQIGALLELEVAERESWSERDWAWLRARVREALAKRGVHVEAAR
jgi:hypothetical protein